MFERITSRMWRRFGRPDRGQDLLEYSLLVALIALVALSAVREVGTTITGVFWEAIDVATNAL